MSLRLRHPEVGDAGHAVGADDDVARGHVAVHQVELVARVVGELVGGVQASERVDRDRHDELGGPRGLVAPQEAIERHALHVVHDHEVAAAVVAEVDRAHDVRVVEARGDARLVHQHVDELGVLAEVGVHHLQRVEPGEARLAGDAGEVHRAARTARTAEGSKGRRS